MNTFTPLTLIRITRWSSCLKLLGMAWAKFLSIREAQWTSSFVVGLILYGWTVCLYSSSIKILCMWYDGLMPFKSKRVHPIVFLLSCRIFTSLFFSSLVKALLRITSFSSFSSKKKHISNVVVVVSVLGSTIVNLFEARFHFLSWFWRNFFSFIQIC